MSYKLNDCFFIKKNGGYKKVCLKDILYLESSGDYVKLYVDNSTPFLIRSSLAKLESLISDERFFRTHRSCIVQLSHIEAINFAEGTATIKGRELPLSRQNAKKLSSYIIRLE